MSGMDVIQQGGTGSANTVSEQHSSRKRTQQYGPDEHEEDEQIQMQPETVVVATEASADAPPGAVPNYTPPPASGTPTDSAYDTMSVKELRSVAAQVGASHDAIEDARDAADPRAQLIALIQMHAKLYWRKTVKELRGIASNAGIGHAAIEDARDAHDPQAALIALITEAQSQP